ncbi:pre-rRNA-processing protein esf1 [Colletotrichum sp. CLE4]
MSSKSGKNGKVTDSRFSNFETDPRFRLPSKKHTKTKIDKRFAHALKDESFTAGPKVDRYGRKVKSDNKKKALKNLYEAEDGEEDSDEGEGIEVDADDVVQRELAKADAKYDPARGGGFSESESESESEDDESDEEETALADPKASVSRLRDEEAQVEEGEVTNRIAIVNLDWDNIKSADLFALFHSFLPSTGGRVEKVAVYPSEFGKERMQREELEGPSKDIFKKDDSEEESEDSEEEDEAIKKELLEEGDADDFDHDALRKYQLDRLRYFYAIMTVSDKATAQKLYEATDGTEYQASSNFLDLRFVPDDTTFDDEPRDECDKLPAGYKPVEFTTDALQHSKVKLTWDVNPDDAARKASINRAFTGSRSQIEENDLKAYLASDSEESGDEFEGFDDEEAAEEEEEEAAEKPKLSKKELARQKMREALGLGAEEEKKASKNAPVGEMEITFTPALTENKKNQKPEEEETTIEKYQRKERERKEAKRQAARARREGKPVTSATDKADEVEVASDDGAEDLGFDDPFFTTDEPTKTKTKTSVRKEERLAKRAAREAEEKEKAEHKKQLELLMADDKTDAAEHLDHFDMNEIIKAEKAKKKKGKAAKRLAKKAAADGEKLGLQEDFKMDVGDDRFKAVFDSHEFAIDPSNPKFKGTEAMQKLLEEGRKKRKAGGDGEDVPVEREGKKAKKAKKVGGGDDEEELSRLVASVKKKAASKAGKR